MADKSKVFIDVGLNDDNQPILRAEHDGEELFLVMTPEEARAVAAALNTVADKAEKKRN